MGETDYYLSLIQLQTYSDEELYRLFMFSDRDRNTIFRAACTYFMCIMESNRRSEDGIEAEHMTVRCLANIFNPDHNLIFQLDGQYEMFAIDYTMIVYDKNWIPYIFTIIENDERCVWKYFGMCNENEYVRFTS